MRYPRSITGQLTVATDYVQMGRGGVYYRQSLSSRRALTGRCNSAGHERRDSNWYPPSIIF